MAQNSLVLILNILTLSYTSLIKPAREEAYKLLENDINLDKHPLLKAKIQDKIIHFE